MVVDRAEKHCSKQMDIDALSSGGSHRLSEIENKLPLKPVVCQVVKAEASCASTDGKAGMQPVVQTSASPEERLEEGQRELWCSLCIVRRHHVGTPRPS